MRTRVVLGFATAVVFAVFYFVDPIPQDLAYHQFADGRTLLHVPNFWNVVSNLPFLVTGSIGLWYFSATDRNALDAQIEPQVFLAYNVFFLGVTLTCFGSGWYHLAPGNGTLVWDRLPMTFAFIGLFTIVIAEHVSAHAARQLFWPLLSIGAAAVVYWHVTELQGAGDLRPYAIVQFLPMVLIPGILIAYPSRYGNTGFYWGMLAAYLVSKLFEHFDLQVFDVLQVISGHSIKHVAAAIAPALFLYGISRRPTRITSGASHAGCF